MNLRHLGYLIAAADQLSITEAASSLGVSQPAVSAALKHFEEEFGYSLFVRNPAQGLSLTPAGRQFIAHARHLLENVRDFEQQAAGLRSELSGEVHVACYSITAPYLVPPVFELLAQRHPGVSINLHEGDMSAVISYLKSGTADVALTYDTYSDNAIVFEELFKTSPHVILPEGDPLAEDDVISLQQLADKPMVLLDLPVAHDYFHNLFATHGLKPTVRYRLKTFELVRSVVGAGAGFSFGLLPIRVDRTYDGRPLVRRTIKEDVPTPMVCLASAARSVPTRIVKAFADTCRDVLGDEMAMPGWHTPPTR